MQASPLPQAAAPVQQVWPLAPHGSQEVVTAPSPAFVAQVNPVSQVAARPSPQQAWPEPPQGVQVPPIPIVAPVQRPPVWQTSPGQQAPLRAPQFMQVRGWPAPGVAQARPLVQLSPAQHTWPLAPHGAQVAPPSAVWQERSAPQASPAAPVQQASPRLPQLEQVPPLQRVPDAVQLSGSGRPPSTAPPQQG